MGSDLNKDPQLTCKFMVEINGIQVTGFEKVSGVNFKTERGETRVGTDPMHTTKYAGMEKYEDVTLTKQLRQEGATDNKEFWDWHARKSADKRDISIVGLDVSGNEVRRWNLYGVWILDIKSNDYDASQETEAVIDEIVLSIDSGELAD